MIHGTVKTHNYVINTAIKQRIQSNRGMGREYKLFLSNLADKLSRKNGESYASTISWLRTSISFEILRSVHTCVRGSRTPFHKNADFLDDFSVNARNADIF